MKNPHSPPAAVVANVLLALGGKNIACLNVSKVEVAKSIFNNVESSNPVFKETSSTSEIYRALRSGIYDLVVIDEEVVARAPQVLLMIREAGIPLLFIKDDKSSLLQIDDLPGYQESYWADRRSLIRGARRSVRNALQHAITYGVERDRLISRVLNLFLEGDQLDLSQVLPNALAEIGKFCGIDRVYVWNFHLDGSLMSKSYHWGKQGIKFHFDLGEEIPINVYSWVVSKIKNGEIVSFSSASELPSEAISDRNVFKLANTLSFLGVPLISKGVVKGFIGFSSVGREREWGERTIDLTSSLSRIFVSALEINRAQQALVRFEDYVSKIAENLNEGLLIADSSGVVEHLNPSASTMLGLDSKQAIGVDIKLLLGEPAWLAVLNSANAKKDSTLLSDETLELCNQEGEVRWLKFNAASMAGDQGFGINLYNKFIILIVDVSAQRRVEDQLRHSQSMDALGRVVGGVAHDFNNLLTAVLGYSGLLLNKLPEDSPYRFELTQVKKASEQAAGLVNQLLTFSRKQVLSPKVIDVNEVISETTRMLRRLIGEDINLELNLAEDLPNSRLDRVQLQQIVMNLAINARDAMPEGGNLVIRTRIIENSEEFSLPQSPYIELSVVDTGTGIPDNVLPHIFEPFYTTKDLGKGTGLGLSTVYGAVKQSGGDIIVNTNIGEGTSFRIAFPISKGISEVRESTLIPEKFRNGSETVLLVEDDQPVRSLIKQVLNSQGYKVLEAVNGNEALRICRSYPNKIQLLIADMVMPEISGSQVVEEFIQTRPHSKILVISGYIREKSLTKILSQPSCLFLPKPFTSETLLGSIDCLMSEQSGLPNFEQLGESRELKI